MMHTELDVWKDSIKLVGEVFKVSERLPKHQRYGLCQQMQRACVSVPSNIAEGASRSSLKEYLRFLRISYSSLSELHTQLVIVDELGYINKEDLPFSQVMKIRKMLYRLKQSLERKI